MGCIPDIEKTNVMYDFYCMGLSLKEVGDIFGVSRQSVYLRLKRRCLKLKTIPLLEFKIFNGNKYTLRNTGYFGKTKGNRALMHRDVWEFYYGKIPHRHDIHHLDTDKANNDISNLELLTKAEHARRYSSGKNQYSQKND